MTKKWLCFHEEFDQAEDYANWLSLGEIQTKDLFLYMYGCPDTSTKTHCEA